MNANNNFKTHIQYNNYPGRGIVLGRNHEDSWIVIYWIMGRSDNSRNRIFKYKNNILSTEAADPALVKDPSLIIYNAMRDIGHNVIITNGVQTDIIYNKLMLGSSFLTSLAYETYEPDAPNYTSRISGYLDKNFKSISLSVIKRNHTGNTDHCFYRYSDIPLGVGYCITTYTGDWKTPLESFKWEPLTLPLNGNADQIANTYWEGLNEDNRISIMVRELNTPGSIKIINKY
ncbi:MAG: inosine monophosphate cyclohydrolase [Methanobacteriota archaeon]|jgi:IMP cyclohydrolase|nr:MAG: inosine monophosphate cyclohydrolase [Euryarchaeota archaeon]